MRIEEKALILPTLYIIKRDGPTSTTDLITELTAVFNPTGEDAKILEGRRDTKFSQKVRNLKSHRDSNKMDIYTDINSSGKYTLTEKGEKYLTENIDQVEYLFSNKFTSSEVADVVTAIEKTSGKKRKVYVYSEDDMVTEGTAVSKETVIKKRSRKLRMAAIEHYRKSDGKIYCAACGFCFEDKYGDIGKDFIEIHHENPVYQYSDDGFEAYVSEAVKKVRPLCANCHRMIHHNGKRPLSINELKKLIK
jgi:predicted HNH restriction endonuclease